MNDRDRLAADLKAELPINGDADAIADRLIALGWTKCHHDAKWIEQFAAWCVKAAPLDEERLARALHLRLGHVDQHPDWRGCAWCQPEAAAIAEAYREDD